MDEVEEEVKKRLGDFGKSSSGGFIVMTMVLFLSSMSLTGYSLSLISASSGYWSYIIQDERANERYVLLQDIETEMKTQMGGRDLDTFINELPLLEFIRNTRYAVKYVDRFLGDDDVVYYLFEIRILGSPETVFPAFVKGEGPLRLYLINL